MGADFFVHPLAVVEPNCQIGIGAKVWHFAHVRTGAVVGSGTILGKNVFVDAGARIGCNVKVQNNVSVYRGVDIADGVFVGPHVVFTNDKLPRAVDPEGNLLTDTQWELARTKIDAGASIGANATIVAGITIGAWAMIGAGAVVTRDVPAHALAVGNPARLVGVVARSGEVVSRLYAPGRYSTKDGHEIVEVGMADGKQR